MRVRAFRAFVGRWRFRYFVHLRKRLRTLESPDAQPVTIEHNLKSLSDHVNARMERLVQPLAAIETLDADSRILVIGPRTEADLLLLIGYGFQSKNVRGLDLISYSPWIELGDMHEIPFEDDSQDAVVLGWVLAYSQEPERVAREMLRVARHGALLAIGVEYSELSNAEVEKLIGYKINETDRPRINSVPAMLELFAGYVDSVIFSHDAPKKVSHTPQGLVPQPSSVIVIFSIDKRGRDAGPAV